MYYNFIILLERVGQYLYSLHNIVIWNFTPTFFTWLQSKFQRKNLCCNLSLSQLIIYALLAGPHAAVFCYLTPLILNSCVRRHGFNQLASSCNINAFSRILWWARADNRPPAPACIVKSFAAFKNDVDGTEAYEIKNYAPIKCLGREIIHVLRA